MSSKKIVVLLLALGIGVTSCALVNQINTKDAFADSVKQNIVYTKDNVSTISQESFDIGEDEKEAYKEKSQDILKKYFNISVEENENFKFSACILNENALDDIKVKELNSMKELYDKNQISKEEYDKEIAYIQENDDGLKNRVSKLKHGMVQTGWVGDDKCYMLDFNENTKELDFVLVSEGIPNKSDASLKISEEQSKDIAENFIKEHNLGDIENPKCILVKGKRLFYEDKNDPSKKVHVGINSVTGKVSNFSVKSYAELEYNNAINEK